MTNSSSLLPDKPDNGNPDCGGPGSAGTQALTNLRYCLAMVGSLCNCSRTFCCFSLVDTRICLYSTCCRLSGDGDVLRHLRRPCTCHLAWGRIAGPCLFCNSALGTRISAIGPRGGPRIWWGLMYQVLYSNQDQQRSRNLYRSKASRCSRRSAARRS